MSRFVKVSNWGAVGPFGWSADKLGDPVGSYPLTELPEVPEQIKSTLRASRLRRSSPISRYLMAASNEALQSFPVTERSLDVLVTMYNGNVSHTVSFFEGVIDNPLQASPILFPETVFNAPASHLAATLQVTGDHLTLLGDSSIFLVALARGIARLLAGTTDAVLVACAEEAHPVVAAAAHTFDPDTQITSGAGAVLLELNDDEKPGDIEVVAVSDFQHYRGSTYQSVATAISQVRNELESVAGDSRLLSCDTTGLNKIKVAEQHAWEGWPGRSVGIAQQFGWSPGAAAGWQFVAACQWLKQCGEPCTAAVSATGDSLGAIGSLLRVK